MAENSILGLPTKLMEITHSMAHFPLKLHKTYYEQGFFNVTVDFDGYVRDEEGPIPLLLGAGVVIEGRIDRHANQNATARIHGGALLRDWFQQNFACGDVVNVDLSSTEQIRLMK